MKTRTKVTIAGAILVAFVIGVASGGNDSGSVTSTTVEAVATTVQPATTTTTTTVRRTTTTTTLAATIDDVIAVTRATSLNRYPDTLTWVDAADDDGIAYLADLICQMYDATGKDKYQTVTLMSQSFFEGYTQYVSEDLELFDWFATGVIDLLCDGGGV